MSYISDKRLYVARDGTTVVEEGDERAAMLIAVPGSEMSDEDAQRYGLLEAKARRAPPATKQVKGPPQAK